MSVKTQRKSNADAVAYKVKPTSKVRGSASKATSRSNGNGKHPLSSYEHLHVGVVQTSLKGKYMDVNEEFCRILGYSREDLLQQSAKDFTHEDDYALELKLHEQLVAGKIPFYALEKRYIRKDGQPVWVELTRSLVRDEKGKPLCTMGVVTDISEYKQVERVLRESAENLRIATEAARMFKWELDFQKQLYTFADNFVQVLGFSGGLFPQNSVETVWRLSPEEDVRTISKAIDKAIKNHSDLSSLQYRINNPENGQTVWLEANAKIVYDAKGNALRMFGVAQNITEEKKTQEEIRILSKLPEENPNPVMRLTPEGNVLYANDSSTHLLEAWKQQTDDAILRELQKHIAETFASGSRKEIELSQNGKTFSFTLAPIREAGYVNLYGIDITLRKQVEEALRAKESELQEIINRTPFMLTRCSRDLRYRFVSNAYARMIGRTPEEVAGKPILEIMGEKGLKTIFPYIERVLQGEQVEYETEVPFEGSGAPNLHVIYTPDRDEQGTVIGWFASIIDITERERTEQVLAEFARRQEALYRLSDQLHHTDSLADVYESALNAILSALQCDRASILLFDDTNVMRFVAWRGLSDEYRQATEGHSPWNSDEKNPYPICIGDVRASDLSDSLKATIQKEGIASLAFIPLVLNGKLIGKFMVYFDALHECSDNEIELGLMIARQVAFGIDRKQAEETLRVRARQQQAVARLGELAVRERDLQKVFDHTAGIITETLDIEYCKILELLEDKETLLLRAGVGWKQGLVGKATMSAGMGSQAGYTLLSDTPVVVADFREEQRFNGPPLLMEHGVISGMTCILYGVNGSPWGVIGAHATRRTNFTQDDVNFLTAVANILSDAIQRQQADQALWQSEERYRAVVESQAEMLCRFQPDGTILFVNEAYARARGTTVKKLIHANFWEFIPQEDRPALQTMLENLTSEAPEARVENRFQTFEGERWTLWTNRALGFDASGRVLEVQATGIDITDRKQAEEQLHRSAEFDAFRVVLTDALRSLNDPEKILAEAMRVLGEKLQVDRVLYSEIAEDDETILILDNYVKDGVPRLTGQASLDDYGKARGILEAGQNLIIMDATTSPDMDEKDRAAFAALGIRSGLAIPLIKNGRWAATLGVHHGSVRAWTENEIKSVEETAERTWSTLERARAQEKLRASETLYRTIARSIPGGGVYVVDRDFRYLVAEGPVTKTFGLSRDMLEGRTVWEAFPGERGERMRERLQRTYEGETVNFETEYDGRVYWTQQAPLQDSIGQAIIVTIEITERKRAEEALRIENERFMRFVNSNIVGILIGDAQGKVVLANDYYLRLLGVSRQDLLEEKVDWRQFTPPEWLSADEKAIQELRERGVCEPYEKEYIRTDGTRVPVYIADALLPGPGGEIAAFVLDITGRKQAEEALRQSEERFARFMQHLPGLAWIKDVQGRYVYANAAAEAAFSIPREKLYGRTDLEVFSSESADQFRKNDEQALISEKGLQTVETLHQVDGVLHYSLVTKFPIPGPDGKAAWIGGTAFDITERLQAEEELRKSEERYRGLFDLVPIAVYTCDANGLIQEYNQRAVELWGREPKINDPQETRYCGSYKLYSPDGRLMTHENSPMSRVLAGETLDRAETEIMVERPDGSRRHAIAHPLLLRDEHGQIIEAINCLYDITEHKQAEEALRESEGRFSAILRQATAGIVRKDMEGRFIFVNQAFCNMLGYTEEELLGKNFWQFTYHEDIPENKRLYDRMMREGISFKLEKRVIRRDGSIIWIDVSVAPVMDAEGKPQSAVAVEVDITGRKQAEEALQQLNMQLESRVQKRTATIQAMNQSLRDEIAERKRVEEALRVSEATALASEEKLRTLFDLLPVGISFLDPDGKVLQMNSALLNIVKLSKEELLGQKYLSRKYIRADGTPMPFTEFAGARALAEAKTIYNVETGIVLEDGDVIWTSVSAAPVDVADVSVVVVTVDITDSKRAEQALQESHARLRILSQRLVEVQEEERRALARELHDRVGQTLAALNINLIIINSQLSTEVVQQIGARLSDSMKLVGETIALVRDVMTDLRPAVLDDYGLEAALEAHLSGFQSRYNIQVAFEKPERSIPRLGPSIEMTFLRIAQEALINIAKHAHAGRVDLSLREEAEAICLTIQDDGTGIESWQHANRPGSHGLTIMRERAEAFGGTLKVKSVPDQGTVVEASIPFRKSEHEEQKKI